MSNSHFRVYIGRDADCFRLYLEPLLRHLFPGVNIQNPGNVSDRVNCVIDAIHNGGAKNIQKYKNTPNLKIIVISGEPNGVSTNVAGFVHLFIDCKRDPTLRPHNVPFVYFPFYAVSFAERLHHPRDLLVPCDVMTTLRSKTKFCAFMYSQQVQFRNELFDAVNHYKPVDALGVCRSNKQRHETDRTTYDLATRTYFESAVDQYRPYKFVIACENSRINGYITEKLINPVLAHAVPIYLGAPDLFSDNVFNRKAIIHVADFPSYQACVDHVKKVDQDDNLYRQYLREPLFINNQLPVYFRSDYLLNSLLRVFGQS